MNQTVRIKPAGKHYVRHPDNGHRHLSQVGADGLPGEPVEMTAYWYRRLADKEIVIVEPVDTDAGKTTSKESK